MLMLLYTHDKKNLVLPSMELGNLIGKGVLSVGLFARVCVCVCACFVLFCCCYCSSWLVGWLASWLVGWGFFFWFGARDPIQELMCVGQMLHH